jgi:uncharacterized protein (TIGR03118 family)
MQHRRIALILAVGLALVTFSSAAMAQYQLTTLTSNQVGWAKHIDPLMVNAWGLVHGPGTPWWLSDNASGWSTLYNDQGQIIEKLKVVVPTGGGNGPGSPTGIVFNGSSDFQVSGGSAPFLFATLDGTISGWAPSVNPNTAMVAINNSKAGAVYTGLAITSHASGNWLYAANIAMNQVEIYDGSWNLVSTFTDATLPSGFAPFGIQDINGIVYVTFASTTGGTGGYVEQFSESGTPLSPGKPLISGAPLNQPWGIVAAPANFGPLSNTLLISNNTNSGSIHAFNATTGAFVGTIKDTTGKPIAINQLWGIAFGDGSANNGAKNELFYTAGPTGNLTGSFGSIVLAP